MGGGVNKEDDNMRKTYQKDGTEYMLLPDGTERKVYTYNLKSTEPKPKLAEGARTPDRCYEYDTQKVYIFDEDINDWILQ
jgi:hypothetical protein